MTMMRHDFMELTLVRAIEFFPRYKEADVAVLESSEFYLRALTLLFFYLIFLIFFMFSVAKVKVCRLNGVFL